MLSIWSGPKFLLCGNWLNIGILDLTIKAFADDILMVAKSEKYVLDRLESIVGKREIAASLTMYSKPSILMVVIRWG